MARFRKKPVVIEAVQWFPGKQIEGVREYDEEGTRIGELSAGAAHHGYITTLEGDMRVTAGDWVITGVKGEKYPIKDSIFRETYDPLEERSSADLDYLHEGG